MGLNMVQVLVNRICGALITVTPGIHLGRQGVNKFVRQPGNPPEALQVFAERMGLELGNQIDLVQIGIDKVAQHKINDPVRSEIQRYP